MKQMLKDIRIMYDDPITIFYDNLGAIKISKNLVLHSNTKHILIKFHFMREKLNEKEVKLEYVSTKE
jgi:hypothetical protein